MSLTGNVVIEGSMAKCEKLMSLNDVNEALSGLLGFANEVERNSEVVKNSFFNQPTDDVKNEIAPWPHMNKVESLQALIDEIGSHLSRTQNNIMDMSQLIGD